MFIMEATYCQKKGLISPMHSFLTIAFAKLLCLTQRKMYTAQMVLDEILQFYKTDAAALHHTTPDHNICPLPSLPPLKDKDLGIVKSITAFTNAATVMITTIGILIYIWKRHRYSFVHVIMFSTISSFTMTTHKTLNRCLH